jgi:hypothetical protein
LPVVLVFAPFGALQVSALGGPQLLDPRFDLTGLAAIALPAIAMRADEEETTAIVGFTRPLTERFFRRRWE